MNNQNRFCSHFICVVLVLSVALFGCNNSYNATKKSAIESENGYALLVEIGTNAQKIPPLGANANSVTRKQFVASGASLIEELKIVLQKKCYVQDELRPRIYEENIRDTFLHFKPLVTLLRESCRLAVDEKNTESVLQNAFLLINLGKSICNGGDRDDQNVGFIFMRQGVVLLYNYLRTQPKDLDDSIRHLFIDLKGNIESASTTVNRLPKKSEILQHDAAKERAVEIQNNRISVMYACFDMCRIAFELELRKKTTGKYPKELANIQCSTPLPVDPWSEQSYAYTEQENSYQLYSTGIDKVDNGGDTPKIDVLVMSGSGDIDISKM
jgi:hypothetical protein